MRVLSTGIQTHTHTHRLAYSVPLRLCLVATTVSSKLEANVKEEAEEERNGRVKQERGESRAPPISRQHLTAVVVVMVVEVAGGMQIQAVLEVHTLTETDRHALKQNDD